MTFILKCRASQKIAIAFFGAKTGKSSSFLSHWLSRSRKSEFGKKFPTFLPCRLWRASYGWPRP
ncbi:hypothetical protein EHQ12_08895 [Leptospira gomenensis]|uniref:Uncharacterized protein n=1 Tax=Leptospira gomenensis TaxID=2484974 RepID=A0A5F1YFS0_9LEPT|nr:hypothetical protein EHQ17_03160 [Leptospira gomenensis]TGK39431.1 hypothetical protein EHQ12_08895 [Leptospira gomenensis]TGK43147.1 hypothetical protein EHQ07_13455 [Leptospira gomenensis]TGK55024.1 hypothetical protein EHQ13_17755 [Leptospira gomenensis]